VREAGAVDALGLADVRRAVAADRDAVAVGQRARQARRPQPLVADGAQHDLVQLDQLVQAGFDRVVRAGHQLGLRLAEVGGDARMRQRRAEGRRMRRQRQLPVGTHAQAFLLDAAAHAAQHVRRQRPQAVLQGGHGILLRVP